jgi:hypothetical protein
MEKLTERQLHDVTVHAGQRMCRDLKDALQLVEDNKQRVILIQTLASAMLDLAAELTVQCYFEDTGRTITKEAAARAAIRVCMDDLDL